MRIRAGVPARGPAIWTLVILTLISPQVVADRVHIHVEREASHWLGVTFAQTDLTYEEVGGEELRQQPLTAALRMGVLPFEYIGAELRAARGITGGEDRTLGRKDRIDHLLSGFLVGEVPVIRDIYLRGYAGVADVQVSVSTDGGTARFNQQDPAWGVAGLWRPMQELGLSVEYTHYSSKYGLDVEGYEIGALFFF